MELELTHDPVAFLERAGAHLASDPVLTTVVATVAERAVREAGEGIAVPPEHWWVSVLEAGRVVGVAMRTAPFEPRPAYVLPMPDAAAVALAQLLHECGEVLDAVNGALPAARTLLEEVARLAGGHVEVRQHTRLFELTDLVEPRRVPGQLRAARPDEADLACAWFAAFAGDADEQAGRARATGAHEAPTRADMVRRIAQGRVWLWEDEGGAVVHLTASNAPALGAARIGPVFTPPEHRGRGWASAAVAEVTRRVQASGARPCLFTDQANPTSNRIYQALGYRPVVDMANLVRCPEV